MSTIFFTGFPGFLGSELVPRVLGRSEDTSAICLIQEKFADLAMEYSDCPSAPKGGDLGQFPSGAMHPIFEEATLECEIDGITDVVETPFGYHVINRGVGNRKRAFAREELDLSPFMSPFMHVKGAAQRRRSSLLTCGRSIGR